MRLYAVAQSVVMPVASRGLNRRWDARSAFAANQDQHRQRLVAKRAGEQ